MTVKNDNYFLRRFVVEIFLCFEKFGFPFVTGRGLANDLLHLRFLVQVIRLNEKLDKEM